MMELLGLPLDKALEALTQSGVTDVKIERYSAPRDNNTRGTLRVVRIRDGGRVLTVCLFPDDVHAAAEEENEV